MNVITGDENGFLKLVNTSRRSYTPVGNQSRNNGVKGLTWAIDGPSHSITNIFSALRSGGELEFWKHDAEAVLLHSLSALTIQTGFQNPTGLVSIWGGQQSAAHVVAYDGNGDCVVAAYRTTPKPTANEAKLVKPSKGAKRKVDGQSVASETTIEKDQPFKNITKEEIMADYDECFIHNASEGTKSTNEEHVNEQRMARGSASVIAAFNASGKDATEDAPSVTISSTFNACVGMENGFAIGGKECDLKLFDISRAISTTTTSAFETIAPIWKAKNVPNDSLSLRVPIWITDVKLRFPHGIHGAATASGTELITGTAYRQVRVYDTKAKRQPVLNIENCSDYRISSIQPTLDGQYVYVGDASGGLTLYDFRTTRRVSTLKGSTGSIRSQYLSYDGKCLATTGLDRHVRLYSAATSAKDSTDSGKKKSLGSVYLKNRLNCVLISDQYTHLQKSTTNMPSADFEVDESNEGSEDIVEEFSDSEEEEEEEDEEDEEEPVVKKPRSQPSRKR